MKRWRIAFVVPRYGEEILGGAEALARGLAEQLVATGLADAQILTTCVRNHITWENELPPGETLVNGIPVLRFPMTWTREDETRYHALHWRLIQGELLPVDEQYEWVNTSPHSPQLCAYVQAQGITFDFIFFIPYLFGTTYYGSAIYPARSILWPCLHDELYAYLRPTRDVYRACRGVMFNSYPESRLAHRLYGAHPGSQVVGFGFSPIEPNGARFREQSGIREPFILYSGRMEGAKNVPLLIQNFIAYKRRRRKALKLVLMGSGPEEIPKHPDIVRLGFKQRQEKLDVYAAAALLCQPSVNESFSIVIMESWQCGVPILAHANCEVTRYHVVQSNGVLYFRDYEEFESILDLLLGDESLRQRLGANGKKYVETQYNWESMLRRFQAALESWKEPR